MRSPRFVAAIVGLSLLGLLPPVTLADARADAPAFEGAPKLRASALLPPALLKSPHYTIREAVTWNGFLFQFEIESTFGLYRVGSRRMLERRIKEIQTMGKLVSESGSSAYFAGMKTRLIQLPTALVGIAKDPADTVEAVPKVVSKTFGRVSGLFHHEKGSAGSSLNPQSIKEDLVATEKRKLATELDVDPYSRNAKLQQLLEEVATERYAGAETVSLASYAIPGGAGTILYDAASYRGQITDMLASMSVSELRQKNAARLRQAGIHSYLANQFLQSTVYLPSFQTVIVTAISSLGGVSNLDAILEAALEARDDVHALLQTEQAVALAHLHRNRERLSRLDAVGGAVVAQSQSGGTLVLAPIDGAYWDQHASVVLRALLASPLMQRTSRRVLYIKGGTTPRFRQAAKDQGVTVAGWPVKTK